VTSQSHLDRAPSADTGTGTEGWHGLVSLSNQDAATLARLVDILFPEGDDHLSASGIGVVTYIDRTLSGNNVALQGAYRRGLRALNEASITRTGREFAVADEAACASLVRQLSAGTLPDLASPAPSEFFELVRGHCQEGLFADPAYGGNRDTAGWRFLNHPGIWLENSAEENLSDEPVTKPRILHLGSEEVRPYDAGAPRALPAAYDPGRGAQPSTDPADVIIVGLGAVGGLVAPVFTDAGLNVVAFEAGPWRTGDDFRPDELASTHYTEARMGKKFSSETPRWRRAAGEPTQEATSSLGRMVNGVGGSWAIAGGWARRFHPHHFRYRTHVQERWGEELLPSDSTLTDWPIGYDELEPYYSLVEHLIGVSGDDDNPFLRRSKPYPLPPLRPCRVGEDFTTAATGLGLNARPIPVNTNSAGYNGMPGTRYSPWAAGFGPWDGDRWHPGLTSVPNAMRSGRLDLRTECRVVRILEDETGRACGVEYVGPDGVHRTQEARCVILSSYTYENVRLLLLSTSDRHPRGMGNNAGQVGQHYMTRMFNDVFGYFPDKVFNRHTGPASQAVAVEDFLAEDFDAGSLGFVGGASLSVENQQLPLQISRAPLPEDVQPWGRAYQDHLRKWQNLASVRVLPEALPYRQHTIDLDPVHLDDSPLALPRVRVTYDLLPNENRLSDWAEGKAEELLRAMGATKTWRGPRFTGVCSCHDMGGCRMGEDPNESVVDAGLAVHDTEGLYVFGGAVFPSMPGINPTLTIWALAYRAAERLTQQLLGASR
jgi:gluconate 2-dehydrogenase alpha chain